MIHPYCWKISHILQYPRDQGAAGVKEGEKARNRETKM
jgi:hypothetical protein